MRRAHTVEQVRAAEAALMATLPTGTLMQRAATGLAYAVLDLLGGAYGRRVLLLVGKGDNGGDALLAGRLLSARGARVDVWRAGEPLPRGAYDVVVDGIVGIGGSPGLRPDAVAALDAVRGVPVVAVDLPSGVDVDSGETPGSHVRADLTVTFGTHKLCHLVDPAASACGTVRLVDIGLDLGAPAAEVLDAEDVAALVPRPDPQAQKYARGVVGVRTGSSTYPGAALLSVAGANAGLAGMVRYVGSAEDAVKQHHPEVVGDGRVQAWVVGSGGGADAAAHLEAALADDVPLVVDADGLAALAALSSPGRPSGGGRLPASTNRGGSDLVSPSGPIEVPSAAIGTPDGGSRAAARTNRGGGDLVSPSGPIEVPSAPIGTRSEEESEPEEEPEQRREPEQQEREQAGGRYDGRVGQRCVLTPHAGELAGLLGVEREQVEARPLAHLHEAVERFGCTVLLKGRRTLVGTPGRAVRVNTTGTPWLATAGAGDVLAGLVGSLLAAGLDPHDAASVGAWLHGEAARAASGGGPITASRVAAALPGVIADVLRVRD